MPKLARVSLLQDFWKLSFLQIPAISLHAPCVGSEIVSPSTLISQGAMLLPLAPQPSPESSPQDKAILQAGHHGYHYSGPGGKVTISISLTIPKIWKAGSLIPTARQNVCTVSAQLHGGNRASECESCLQIRPPPHPSRALGAATKSPRGSGDSVVTRAW